MNFLEQMVAEWYEYQGFFVLRNVLVGKREKGGYECELDVVAFLPDPVKPELIHVEASTDADSWQKRDQRFKKKFDAGRKYITKLYKGLELPETMNQYAVLVFTGRDTNRTVGGCRVVSASKLLSDILANVGSKSIYDHMVPEKFPILRTLQFVSENRKAVGEIFALLDAPTKHVKDSSRDR